MVDRHRVWDRIAEHARDLPGRGRLAARTHADMPADEPIRIVPDWVCEILSPNTRRHDLVTKLPYYAKVGVAYAWLVDLEARVLTSQRLESGRWLTLGVYTDETEARIEPFDVVPLNVADWWPPAASKD